MRSLIATANSRRTIAVTRGEVIKNSGWLAVELSSDPALVLWLMVVQSVSVKHSTRLQASKIWSRASSSLALRSLGRQTHSFRWPLQDQLHVILPVVVAFVCLFKGVPMEVL